MAGLELTLAVILRLTPSIILDRTNTSTAGPG